MPTPFGKKPVVLVGPLGFKSAMLRVFMCAVLPYSQNNHDVRYCNTDSVVHFKCHCSTQVTAHFPYINAGQ